MSSIRIDNTLSNAEYHAHTESVSSSYLKTMLAASQAAAEVPHTSESAALKFGTAAHTLILEGREAFDASHEVMPSDVNLRTKAGREWKAGVEATGKAVISVDDMQRLEAMAEAVGKHVKAARMLEEANLREVSMFWEDAETGVRCRARPDAYSEVPAAIIDLKTTSRFDAFETEMFKYGYDIQGAFYARAVRLATGIEGVRFTIVAVETVAPFRVGLFDLAPYVLEEADETVGMLLEMVEVSGRFGGRRSIASWDSMPLYTGNVARTVDEIPQYVRRDRMQLAVEWEANRWMRTGD